MFFRKETEPQPAPLPHELHRLVDVWPELSERTRFGLMMLTSASLLKNAKLRAGFAALGSSLRFQGGVLWRDTRRGLQNAGRRIARWV